MSQFFQAVVSGLHVQAPVLTIFIFLFLPDKDTIWQPIYSKRQCGELWILTTLSLLIASLCCYRKRSGRTRTSCIRIAPQNPLETTHVLSSYNFPSLYLSALKILDVEALSSLRISPQPANFHAQKNFCSHIVLQNRTECDFRPFVYTLYELLWTQERHSSIFCSEVRLSHQIIYPILILQIS